MITLIKFGRNTEIYVEIKGYLVYVYVYYAVEPFISLRWLF